MKLYTSIFIKQNKENKEGQPQEPQATQDKQEEQALVPQVNLTLYEIINGVKYFYGKEIPQGCVEVVDYGGKEEEFVQVFKDRGIFEKSREFKNLIQKFLDSYIPQEELLSWDMQSKEALDYKANPKSETPLITNLCLARYGSLENLPTLVQKILEKSNAYKVLSGNLIGQKQAIIDKLENAKTMQELLGLLDMEIILPTKTKGAK